MLSTRLPTLFRVGSESSSATKAGEQDDGDAAAEPHDVRGHRRVAALARVVVKAVEDRRSKRGADLALGGFEQARACSVFDGYSMP